MFAELLQRCFWLVIFGSGLPLLAAAIAGLVVAVLQGATQIQEQSLGYLVKFAVVTGVVALCAGWYREELAALMRELLGSLAYLGRV